MQLKEKQGLAPARATRWSRLVGVHSRHDRLVARVCDSVQTSALAPLRRRYLTRWISAAFLFAAGTLAACGGSSATTSAPTPSPTAATSVARQIFDRLGVGDAAGAGALLTSDATWSGGPGCDPGRCVGSAAVQKDFRDEGRQPPPLQTEQFRRYRTNCHFQNSGDIRPNSGGGSQPGAGE